MAATSGGPSEQGCSLSLFWLRKYRIESSLPWVLLFLFQVLTSKVLTYQLKSLSRCQIVGVIFCISSGCYCSLLFILQIYVPWSEFAMLTYARFCHFICMLVNSGVSTTIADSIPNCGWTCLLLYVCTSWFQLCLVMYFKCCLLHCWLD